MFKNLTLYTIDQDVDLSADTIEQALIKMPFVPCGPTQELSVGWLPARGIPHGAMVESIGGQLILRFSMETKSVPGPVVQKALDELLANIEREEGRKPGRKETRELREQVVIKLMPNAFPKTNQILVWIDPKARRLAIANATQSRVDEVITALVRCLPDFKAAPINTAMAPQAAMTQWLLAGCNGWPEFFVPGRKVELHSGDEMKSVVKFDRHHLDDEEMRRHIEQGKLPVKLALDFAGRVSFVLTEGGQLRAIQLLDAPVDNQEDMDAFDADVVITTGELAGLIDELINALGGQLL